MKCWKIRCHAHRITIKWHTILQSRECSTIIKKKTEKKVTTLEEIRQIKYGIEDTFDDIFQSKWRRHADDIEYLWIFDGKTIRWWFATICIFNSVRT